MPFFGNSNFVQALGWAVLNSLWQMAFCWVIFQVVLSFGINKPSVKSRLATLFLGVGFAWFLITLFSHWLIDPFAPKSSILSIASSETGNGQKWNDSLQTILPYFSVAYLLLLIAPILQFIRNYRFVQIIRKQGLSKLNIDYRIFVKRFAARMGIRKPIQVYISEFITSPVTIGFLKPFILVPVEAITSLSQKQIEAVLLHELAHIRRYDYFINLLVNVCRTVLYFNPFVKLFVKSIEREREKSCDEMVIRFRHDPHGYATALLALQQNKMMKQTMILGVAGQRNDLLHRIERILGIEKRKTPNFKKMTGLLAGLVCIIGLNALLIFGKPVVQNSSVSFNAQIPNPFYHLISDPNKEFKETETDKSKQKQADGEKNMAKSLAEKINFSTWEKIDQSTSTTAGKQPESEFVNVGERVELLPELDKQQEEQVKKTIEATKQILNEGQWKQVEKNIADAMTESEKQELKYDYYKHLSKVNWEDLEKKLRISYNTIDWDKVNTQVSGAIANIKLDSLTHVYSSALNELNKFQSWMTENNFSFVPDTDVKLDEVKAEKEKVQKQLKTINAIRHRKIIHL